MVVGDSCIDRLVFVRLRRVSSVHVIEIKTLRLIISEFFVVPIDLFVSDVTPNPFACNVTFHSARLTVRPQLAYDSPTQSQNLRKN